MLAISMIIGTIVYPILALAKIVMNMKFVGVHLTLVHSTRVAKGRDTIVLFWGEFISEGAIFSVHLHFHKTYHFSVTHQEHFISACNFSITAKPYIRQKFLLQ